MQLMTMSLMSGPAPAARLCQLEARCPPPMDAYIPPAVPIISAIVLVPQLEALESMLMTDRTAIKSPKEPRQGTPMMQMFCYSATLINLWWMWTLPHKCSAYDTIYYLILDVFLVDIASGIYHWFQDSYRSTNEKVNKAIFENFQLHHESAQPEPTESPVASIQCPSHISCDALACRPVANNQTRLGVRVVGAGRQLHADACVQPVLR
eukprot:SAG22_NODE_125_length_18883_cov_12.351629_16_plen_208_part_00